MPAVRGYTRKGCVFHYADCFVFYIITSAGTQREEDEYQAMACSTSTRNSTRHTCMCGFLRDALPAAIELKSVREQSTCINGVASTSDQEFPCLNVNLMSFVGLTELNSVFGDESDKVNDVWGWTDPVTSSEIAILGMESGTAFVDVTDPTNYVYLGKLPAYGGVSLWRDVKTYGNYAFIVSEYEEHGMQVRGVISLI